MGLNSLLKKKIVEYSIGKEDDDGYTLIKVDSGRFKDLVFRVQKVSLNVEDVKVNADILCLPEGIEPEMVQGKLMKKINQCIIDVVDDIIKQ